MTFHSSPYFHSQRRPDGLVETTLTVTFTITAVGPSLDDQHFEKRDEALKNLNSELHRRLQDQIRNFLHLYPISS